MKKGNYNTHNTSNIDIYKKLEENLVLKFKLVIRNFEDNKNNEYVLKYDRNFYQLLFHLYITLTGF